MKPYSEDLRTRIIDAIDQHDGPLRQIARRFRVSLSSIVRLLRRRRETGAIDPKPHGGGRLPAPDPNRLEQLRERARQQPDATPEELRRRRAVDCRRAAICRAWKKPGITRKKEGLHAQQRDTPEVQEERRAFRQEVAGIDPEHLVFVDESGVNTAMTRAHGRAPAGERVYGAAPGSWGSMTLICGRRPSGVTAPLVVPGATNTPAFQSHVDQVLVPRLKPGDVVIRDSLQPHEADAAVRAVEAAGARVIRLPSSSPDLSPIEGMFSKVKGTLRSAAARPTEAMVTAIGPALHDASPRDIFGWFHSRAAYAIQT
jgi:transposase